MRNVRRAVFFDRDGVLNRAFIKDGKPYPPQTIAQLEVLPGVAESLQRLRKGGYILIGVTNQPDVARGTQYREVVEAINSRVLQILSLDAIYVCFEDGNTEARRKPNPGMLLEAAADFDIHLAGSYLIGDKSADRKRMLIKPSRYVDSLGRLDNLR